MRRSSILLVQAVGSLGLAAAIAAAVYFSGPAKVLRDVAAVARMPMPGTADVELPRGSYGLYFGELNGELNAPTGKVMGVPSLDITIVPPDGVADPAFVNVRPETDVYVDGYHTVQVASITVTTAGRYQVHVESKEQSGGSFSIGQPPAVISAGRNVLRAWPFIGLFTIMGVGIGAVALRARSR